MGGFLVSDMMGLIQWFLVDKKFILLQMKVIGVSPHTTLLKSSKLWWNNSCCWNGLLILIPCSDFQKVCLHQVHTAHLLGVQTCLWVLLFMVYVDKINTELLQLWNDFLRGSFSLKLPEQLKSHKFFFEDVSLATETPWKLWVLGFFKDFPSTEVSLVKILFSFFKKIIYFTSSNCYKEIN